MPVNSDNYNNDAILGAQIEQLVQKVLQKYVEGSNVIAEMGNNFDARLKAIEDVLKSSNVGVFVADSVETQSLKVGGEDVVEALDSKIGNVKAAAGLNIGSVGTPSVTVTNNPTTHESTLTFNYLKGAKGDKGDKGDKGNPGTNGTNGTNGVSCTHSWNGTTLTVTSASGSSSANLKGEKGDPGTSEKRSGMCTASWHKTWSSTPSGGNNPLEYYQDIASEFSSFDASATTDSDVYISRSNGGSAKSHIRLVASNSLNAVKWTYILELKWIGSSSLWGAKNTRILLASSTSATDYADGAYDLAWSCLIMGFGGFNRNVVENPYEIIIPDYYRFISEANVVSNTTLRWTLTVLWKEV